MTFDKWLNEYLKRPDVRNYNPYDLKECWNAAFEVGVSSEQRPVVSPDSEEVIVTRSKNAEGLLPCRLCETYPHLFKTSHVIDCGCRSLQIVNGTSDQLKQIWNDENAEGWPKIKRLKIIWEGK